VNGNGFGNESNNVNTSSSYAYAYNDNNNNDNHSSEANSSINTNSNTVTSYNWSNITQPILINIGQYLDVRDIILRFRHVNRYYRDVSHNRLVWKNSSYELNLNKVGGIYESISLTCIEYVENVIITQTRGDSMAEKFYKRGDVKASDEFHRMISHLLRCCMHMKSLTVGFAFMSDAILYDLRGHLSLSRLAIDDGYGVDSVNAVAVANVRSRAGGTGWVCYTTYTALAEILQNQ